MLKESELGLERTPNLLTDGRPIKSNVWSRFQSRSLYDGAIYERAIYVTIIYDSHTEYISDDDALK